MKSNMILYGRQGEMREGQTRHTPQDCASSSLPLRIPRLEPAGQVMYPTINPSDPRQRRQPPLSYLHRSSPASAADQPRRSIRRDAPRTPRCKSRRDDPTRYRDRPPTLRRPRPRQRRSSPPPLLAPPGNNANRDESVPLRPRRRRTRRRLLLLLLLMMMMLRLRR